MPNGLPDSRPPRGSNTHNSCVLQLGQEQTLGSPRGSGQQELGADLGRGHGPPNPQESPVGPGCMGAVVSPAYLLSKGRLSVEGREGCGAGVPSQELGDS